MRSATALRSWPTRGCWGWGRSPSYWLWIILGYKSISTGRGGELLLRAMSMRSRPDGNSVELCDGRRRDDGAARRGLAVHRLAGGPFEQRDQVLRHLFRPGGRRAQQGFQRDLLGRSGGAGAENFAAPQPPGIRLGPHRGR